MIERHLAHAPTLPSTAYGADYNYTGVQAPYGADTQYAQFTAEQYGRDVGAVAGGGGGGGPAAAGAYGPYAAYAAQQQHPQYPQTQARYQPQSPPYAEQYALNKAMPPAPAFGRTPNPFSPGVTTTSAAAVAAAHAAAATSVRSGSTTPPLAGNARPSSQGSLSGSSGTYLNRQPTQTQQQQQQQAVYADVQRDVKTPHPAPLMVRNATPSLGEKNVAGAGIRKGKARDTVYDMADAYGGM
jgi:hypothetical protein